MNTKQLDAEIRAQIDQFLASISALVRQAAVEAVREALGDTSGTSTASTRRGKAQPGKATRGRSAPRVTKGRKARQTSRAAASKPSKAKPGRRVRRSTADVEKVAAQILAYVKTKPGQRLEEIGRGLKADTAGLKRPIQGLIAAGSLRTEGQKRGTRYFAGGRAVRAKAVAATKKGAGRKAAERATSKAVRQVAVKPTKKVGKRAGRKPARAKAVQAVAEPVAAK